MSKSKERKQKELERRYEKHGYFGFLRLQDVYDFQSWLQDARGFRIYVTAGPELIVGYVDGRYLRVWFSKELRKCCCNRFAMAMWLVWDGIVKRRGAG